MRDTMMIDDAPRATLVMQPVKAMILSSLTEPATTAELAQRLSRPRQRLGYHVRQLEAAGLLEAVGETKVRNCVGRRLQSVARRFLIRPDPSGDDDRNIDPAHNRYSNERLLALSTRAVSEVARLCEKAQTEGVEAPTLCLDGILRFDNAEDQRAFCQELNDVIAALAARYGSGARHATPFRLQTACYPKPGVS